MHFLEIIFSSCTFKSRQTGTFLGLQSKTHFYASRLPLFCMSVSVVLNVFRDCKAHYGPVWTRSLGKLPRYFQGVPSSSRSRPCLGSWMLGFSLHTTHGCFLEQVSPMSPAFSLAPFTETNMHHSCDPSCVVGFLDTYERNATVGRGADM